MPNFRLSCKALSDLVEIGRYTERKWSVNQRNVCLKQIDDCFAELSDNPNLGVTCDYIKKGYRKFPQGSHIIFYRLNSDNILEIIRVLHKSMDVESHL
jgi:toxin ParE1/3/4